MIDRRSSPAITRLVLSTAAFTIVAGCNLAGDLTPPPQLATQQAAQSQLEPAQVQPTEVDVSVIPPPTQPDLTQGEAIFIEKCAPCHGEDGMGAGPMASNLPQEIEPSPLADPEFARAAIPGDWFRVVTEGNLDRLMPGFSSLSDTERWDVVAYAMSLSYAQEDLDQSEALYLEQCAECHGPQGEGKSAGPISEVEQITATSADQLYQVIHEGTSSGMPAFGDELSEDQQRSLAAFIQSLAFTSGASVQESESSQTGDTVETGFATIQGEVLNQTSGEPAMEASDVTLHGFDEDTEVITLEGDLNETGEYVFSDLEIAPGRIFVVTAEYKGVLYGSSAAHLADGESITLPVDVYDTTAEASEIRVDRLHVIFNVPIAGTLEVTELWIISNTGSETFSNTDGEGIFQIHLPDSATNLLFESGTLGDRFIRNEFGVVDQFAVRPGVGSHEIVLSFEMPYDGRLEYQQTMEYPVDAVVVLLPEEGPDLTGEGLQDLGVQDLGGLSFRSFNAASLSPGDHLQLSVRGTPHGLPGSTSKTIELVAGLATLGSVLAVLAFWWYRRVGLGTASAPAIPRSSPQKEKELLIDDIAELDDEFERGEIEEHEYRRERSQLKAEILDLMKGESVD